MLLFKHSENKIGCQWLFDNSFKFDKLHFIRTKSDMFVGIKIKTETWYRFESNKLYLRTQYNYGLINKTINSGWNKNWTALSVYR